MRALGVSFLTAGGSDKKEDKKPVAVQPHELSSAARLPENRRLLGRVVNIEETEGVFTCYLVCGPTRKQVIQVEAWRELKTPAADLLRAGELVSLSNVALSLRKADKMRYSYSGVQLFVRFDNKLKVDAAVDDAKRPVSGFPDLLVEQLAHTIPLTPFSVAVCLREGTVRIRGRVMEAQHHVGKSSTEVGKALLEEEGPGGVKLQAEMIGFAECAAQVGALETDQTYEFFGIAIQPSDDKNGFAFKWVKGGAKMKVEAQRTGVSAPSGAGSVKMLSIRAPGSGGYSAARAVLVSASTLDSIVPATGSRKFENDIVWEVPWVTVTDISRRNSEEWHYVGCSECFKSNCSQHRGDTRNCYAVDLQFVDHTSLLDAKLFTQAADELFKAGGVEEPGALAPAEQEQLLQTLKGMHFSVRLAIREEEAYQNRPARNQLQVVRIRAQDESWSGTVKPLLRIPVSSGKFGIPAMFVKEVTVDAADQVKGPGNIFLDCVELLVQIGKKKPQNHQQEDEAGLRLTVEAQDRGDEHCPAFLLMWVVSIEGLLDLARELLPGAVLCVIARPVVNAGVITAWQVLHHSSTVDVPAWLGRLQWQRQDMEQVAGRKRGPLEAFAEKTPNSKVKVLKETLASPSYTAP